MVDGTPDTRDRTVDFLRAVSIFVVVAWHWVFSITQWNRDGALTMPNPIGAIPALWLATWVLQIMPLFFFVGGFANSVAWNANRRAHGTARTFLVTRMRRLTKPIAVFLVVWAGIDIAAQIVAPGYTSVVHWGFVIFVPLWFLAVYAAVVTLAPLTLELHRRAPIGTLVTLGVSVLLVDAARFALDVDVIGFANVLLVFVFVHQVGYFYGDGTLTRATRRTQWLITFGGLAALALLTTFGPYPRSMVAVQGGAVSNMFPPTACIAALGIFQAGLALLLRPSLNRWLARRRPWKAVVAANAVSMTVFTWHMTALVAAIGVVQLAGGSLIGDATAAWWAERPLWILLPGLFLGGLVALFARFELGKGASSQ
jgi:fucose 4-O-acetylase-like acetyltransferase